MLRNGKSDTLLAQIAALPRYQDPEMQFTQPFLKLPKRFCAERLAAEVRALPSSAWVAHPGNYSGNDAVPLVTPGGQITNAFAGPMAATKHLLGCRYIMEVMADIGAVWGRSRLMGLVAGAVVPAHVDVHYHWHTHVRIHIPVITSPEVIFTCGGESVHMAAGECWTFDSFRMHQVENRGPAKRVHLVLDTVGGPALRGLLEAAERGDAAGAAPPHLEPGTRSLDSLAFEQFNVPQVMSPWEIRCHIAFIRDHMGCQEQLEPFFRRLEAFADDWGAAWAQFGPTPQGWPAYRRLSREVEVDLERMPAGQVQLPNEVPLIREVKELILTVAGPPEGTPARAAQAPAPNMRLSQQSLSAWRR